MVGGSVEDLSVGRWAVVGRLVKEPVVESVVGCW